MLGFLCKVFGHRFKYIKRYYRCTRCGVRRCDIAKEQRKLDGEFQQEVEKIVSSPSWGK